MSKPGLLDHDEKPSIKKLSKRSCFITERISLFISRIGLKFRSHSAVVTGKLHAIMAVRCSSRKASFNFCKYACNSSRLLTLSRSAYLTNKCLKVSTSHLRTLVRTWIIYQQLAICLVSVTNSQLLQWYIRCYCRYRSHPAVLYRRCWCISTLRQTVSLDTTIEYQKPSQFLSSLLSNVPMFSPTWHEQCYYLNMSVTVWKVITYWPHIWLNWQHRQLSDLIKSNECNGPFHHQLFPEFSFELHSNDQATNAPS